LSKPTEKHCYRCARTLPIQAFALNVAKLDGHSDECRQCKRDLDHARTQRITAANLRLRELGRAS
jgi:hypothetical protein